MAIPSNIQRIAVLHSGHRRERCELALSQGWCEGVPEEWRSVDPSHVFMIVAIFKLAPLDSWHIDATGHWIMPMVGDPTPDSSWTVFVTAAGALAALEARKAQMLSEGWLEGEFDPLGDPD